MIMNYYWKCRCMNINNHHCSGVELMSGTWKVHMSLIQHIYPYGLHREWYQVINIDEDLFSDENLRHVKYRNTNKVYR